MNRAERERIAVEVKAGLRDAAARARRGAEQIADMRAAVAGSTHDDAIRVRKLLELAERAPTYAERIKCFNSAWAYAKDYVKARDESKGGTAGAESKKRKAAAWQSPIRRRVERGIAAGRTNSAIAGDLYLDAGRKRGTVEGYVARVKAELKK